MRTSTVTDSIAKIAAIHLAELVCSSKVTDPIVITLGMVGTEGHHNHSVPTGIVVDWVSTMIDTVMNTDTFIEETMIILEVDMNIDIEIEIYPGAGRAAGRLTPEGHITLGTVMILRTADPEVQAIVETGITIEIDAIGLTEVENTAAGLTRSRSPQPDVCVSVDKISIVDGQTDTIRNRILEGIGRLRYLLAIVHRRH